MTTIVLVLFVKVMHVLSLYMTAMLGLCLALLTYGLAVVVAQ